MQLNNNYSFLVVLIVVALHSKLTFKIDATYCCSGSDQLIIRYDFTISAVYDSPLLHSLRASLPAELRKSKPNWLNDSRDIECFEGHSKVSHLSCFVSVANCDCVVLFWYI